MTEFSSDSESEYDVKKFFVKARKQIKKIQKSITFCWDNISVYRKKEQENHSFWRGNKYKNVQLLHNGICLIIRFLKNILKIKLNNFFIFV